MTSLRDQDSTELARLLEGVQEAERLRKEREFTAHKAQASLDKAAADVARWQKVYDDFARELARKAMAGRLTFT